MAAVDAETRQDRAMPSHRLLRFLTGHRLPRFGVVGGIGFLVDATVLFGLFEIAGWNAYAARVASFGVAVTVTWYLNRRFTFSDRASPEKRKEWSRYVLVSMIGNGVNFVIYLLCISTIAFFARYPLLALAIASGIAMFVNYFASDRFAFRARRDATRHTTDD